MRGAGGCFWLGVVVGWAMFFVGGAVAGWAMSFVGVAVVGRAMFL